ncbi:MAG: SGNH/GDSL hydrolase family protein [Armatimonadota bacterium]|nr:SGNH/GDSL hydrolase family protein [Armatimonadota bacterium]
MAIPTMHDSIARLIARLRTEPLTRLVAFGSSNTERAEHCEGAHNWFDWLDVGLKHHYGRVHHCINTGISGETTRELLARFERDVAFYQPHAVIVTIGGNDANPTRNMSTDEYRANLVELMTRLRRLSDCVPILQTYYSFDSERIDPVHAAQFPAFMQIVREVAAATDVALRDNLRRWELLRTRDVESFRALMRDPCHVNRLGHMVWGLDMCRAFDAPLTDQAVPALAAALPIQRRLDEWEKAAI